MFRQNPCQTPFALPPFRLNSVCLLLLVLLPLAVHANETDTPAQALADIEVVGVGQQKPLFQYNQINKTSATLEKEQVNNIRDLTRYDPGIAVNEQGSGASAGYSMRGVDRNRVSILVDGMAQGQVFSPGGLGGAQGEFGGAVNEIEYENIKSVAIQKGADSVQGGSGALGGAVMFTSKEADDVIKPGQNWGLDYKSGYSSKDARTLNSLAMAGRWGGFEGLIQYTHRQGHEIQSHDDAEAQQLTYYYKPLGWNGSDSYQYTDTVAAKNVWGPTRAVANPLDYRSNSWFVRGGYRFNPQHYAGLIFEDTRQRYDMMDMTYPLFYPKVNMGNDSTSGDALRNVSTLWQNNHHQKRRFGLEYRYNAAESSPWLPDGVRISADSQQIDMDNTLSRRRCSRNIDRNCTPIEDGQRISDDHTGTGETSKRLRLEIDKNVTWGFSRHQIQLSAGIGNSRFDHHSYNSDKSVVEDYPCVALGQPWDTCIRKTEHNSAHQQSLSPVYGKNRFLTLSDNIRLGEHFAIPLGLRRDYSQYRSDNRFVPDSTFRNTAWNAGLTFMPNQHIELGYKASTGFRVPSAEELYGSAILYPGDLSNTLSDKGVKPLKQEKALNQEIGLSFKGRLGNARFSAFRADYRDLLGQYKANAQTPTVYGNVQNAHTFGFDVQIMADLHEVHRMLPEGLSSSLAYSIVKPRKSADALGDSDNFVNTNYLMDTLQPARLVWGLDYDAPSGQWGVGARVVHSMPKQDQEIKRLQTHPATGATVTTDAVPALSKKWTTLDLSGWYRWGKHTTLRGGVYNVFNRKYIQWEAMRQLGISGQSTAGVLNVSGDGIQRLTAPGRNFALTLEMKF